MKLHRDIKKTRKGKDSENVPQSQINEVTLVQCNLVNNTCQHDSTVLHMFILNKSIGKLLEISPTNFVFL